MAVSRRSVLQLAGAAVLPAAHASQLVPVTKPIPSSGERMPVIGLGTWITFNVGRDPAGRKESTEVVREFLHLGGKMIDSSPMYGSSQDVVGEALTKVGGHQRVFSADKVWTSGDGAV